MKIENLIPLEKLQRYLFPAVFTVMFISGILALSAMAYYWLNFVKVPHQPIAFSHQKHVQQYGLKCTHCHVHAAQSPRATFPETSICMQCHKSVAVDSPEIKKLARYHSKGEKVPWVKVHNLDWHVYFSHKPHIRAGKDCVECHGELKAMEEVRQTSTLKMGWCVNCHRKNNASRDCLTCHK